MIKSSDDFDSMTDWVGGAKAAKISGLNISNVFRNAMAGRIAFRVKEGHLYFSRDDLAKFDGAPRGRPSHAETNEVSFDPQQRAKIMKVREEIESKYDDAIYRGVAQSDGVGLEIAVYRNGNWQKLPVRRV